MKKITKASELLWIMGIVFVALGVAICNKADLGVSMIAAPAFVIYEAIACLSPSISIGMTEYIIQGLMLILMCLIIQKFNWRYLLAFAVAVIYGYTLNFFVLALESLNINAVSTRWIMLITGDIITAVGVACFFGTYMPLQVYELFVAEFAQHFKVSVNKIKWIFDMSLLVLSIFLTLVLFGDVRSFDWTTIAYSSFHSIGLGTLVTAAINSPAIALMSRLVNKIFDTSPRFIKLEMLLRRR